MLQRLPYSPVLAPTDFFLFPKVKKELVGLTLTRETFKKEWEGAIRTLTAADFAEAFQQWYRRCEKCIAIGGRYVEKNLRNKHVPNYHCFFIDLFRKL
jgi:hypothetical protein